MYSKWLGAVIVIAACGGFGFKLAAAHRKEEQMLRQLVGVLDYMECELQYRLTPLPELCRQAAVEARGELSRLFVSLSQALEDQTSAEVAVCMDSVLSRCQDLPALTCNALGQLGQTLGRFDVDGQLKGFDAVRRECRRLLEGLERNKEIRLRGYQTLGLCAGAALAILFM